WITVLHTFTYCNALQRALARAPSVELVRGLCHGALSVYLDRFLNVPPARLPEPAAVGAGGARVGADVLPGAKSGGAVVAKGTLVGPGGDVDPAAFRRRFLDLLDAQQQVKAAAELAAAYLDAGGDEAPFWRTLGEALLREDAEFHTFQMFEAGHSQWRLWPKGSPQRRLIALATIRYLAGHSPTPRESPKVADIALRLHKGEKLFEE
ncbi:MAG TPA: hypothetical protein VFK80_04270, partial [Limnochordia bacterium]|nr:hypothetical protein [Limnochordia bacterium]